jgi:type I restriction enzyme R subunit
LSSRECRETSAGVASPVGSSAKQFVESPDFDDAVTGAVVDNQGAHEKMSDYFFTSAPGRSHLVSDIAKWFYQVVTSKDENASVH